MAYRRRYRSYRPRRRMVRPRRRYGGRRISRLRRSPGKCGYRL